MIGVILWAVLIIIVAECVCPGLIWVILASLGGYWTAYAAIVTLIRKLKNK